MTVRGALRRWRRGTVLLLLGGLLAAMPLVVSNPAAADDPVEPAPPTYIPTPGLHFNDPTGTQAQQYALNTYLVRAIDNTPAGATLRVAMFSGNIASFKDALLAAHQRGVNVRLIMDGHSTDSDWWRELESALGRDVASPSFAVVCPDSCFDTRSSTMQHAKLYLFSTTGAAQRVSMVGSGNPTMTQAEVGWNDLFTLVDDQVLYNGFVEYFDAMVGSAETLDEVDYYRWIGSGSVRAVFTPSQSSRVKDYYGQVLNNVRCKAAPGFGVKGHTKVTVAMGLWSGARINNAKRLWRLDQAGCVVEVIVTTHALDAKVRAWLRKPTRHGGITFRAASFDFGRNGTVDRYLHEKVVMVGGGYLRQRNATLTFTGTHNFTYNAMRGNDDIILRHTGRATYAQLTKHIVRLRKSSALLPARSARPLTGVPATVDLTQNFSDLESPEAYGD